MSTNHRILVLVEQFGQGGAEKIAYLLSQMLYESQSFDVYFCSIYNSNFSHLNYKGINICSLDIKKPNGMWGKFFNYIYKIKRLYELKKFLNFTINYLTK